LPAAAAGPTLLPMGSYRRVLAAVELDAARLGELGEPARTVLQAADREARLHGADLAVIHALPSDPGAPMSPASMEEALVQRAQLSSAIIEGLLVGIEDLTDRPSDEVAVQVEDGPADEAIVAAAERLQADLVVVGSTGVTGLRRLLLGSVAASVVKHAATSVLVARPSAAAGTVLVAIDFSPASDAALALGMQEARLRGARLCITHSVELFGYDLALGEPGVVPPPAAMVPPEELRQSAHQRLKDLLARASLDGDIEVTVGAAAESIVATAARRQAELLVVGTSGRTGLDRLLLGSVAATVVREAPCPVLVARPASDDRAPGPAPEPPGLAAV
jgi:nucleotide-binding universal stress UspA family protein